MGPRGLGGGGGRGGEVSLSLDSDREVLKLYIRLFDVNSQVNCVVAFHGAFRMLH